MAALAATTVMLGPRQEMATSPTTRADAAPAVRVASVPAARVVAAALARVVRVAPVDSIHGVAVPVVPAPHAAAPAGRAVVAAVQVVPALVRVLVLVDPVRSPRRATAANRATTDVVLVLAVLRAALIHEAAVPVVRVPDVALAVRVAPAALVVELVDLRVLVGRVDGGWLRPKALPAPGRSPILRAGRKPGSPTRRPHGVTREEALLRIA